MDNDIRTMSAYKLAVRILTLTERCAYFERLHNAGLLTEADAAADEWNLAAAALQDAQRQSAARAESIAFLTDDA